MTSIRALQWFARHCCTPLLPHLGSRLQPMLFGSVSLQMMVFHGCSRVEDTMKTFFNLLAPMAESAACKPRPAKAAKTEQEQACLSLLNGDSLRVSETNIHQFDTLLCIHLTCKIAFTSSLTIAISKSNRLNYYTSTGAACFTSREP